MKENEEFDELTEECLRILCCSCAILLKRQLKDQLPGGIYYKPDHHVGAGKQQQFQKKNIISEPDFAQLDKQLEQTPNMSTVAVSELVCFINNKTPEYLENLSQAEKHKMITRAIQEAPNKTSSI